MNLIPIKQLYQDRQLLGKNVSVGGWVRTVRSSAKIAFVEINDGTFFSGLQAVASSELVNLAEVEKATLGSAVILEGKLVESPAAGQKFELQLSKFEILSLAPLDYPLQKKKHSFEFLRTIAHIRPRANTFLAVFRLRSVLSFAIHKFFQEKGFVYVHTPIISSSDCEGAGDVFQVTNLDLRNIPLIDKKDIDYSQDFFGQKTGLAVSGQLNGEALAMAFSKIYTFGPTFRAENSNTPRHASEFWMMEPEMAWTDLVGNMGLAEEMMKYLIKYVLQELPEEMEFFNKFIDTTLLDRLNKILSSDFGRITYTEAIEVLKNCGKKFEYPVQWGLDLQTEHERYLAEEHFQKPVFVTDYPKDIKAFYMRLNDDGQTVAAVDLLVPGVGEIIGGSQREERTEKLEKRMKEMKLNQADYDWYLDLRKYGGVIHSGFGLGFERIIMYLSGMQNIRDVIPFPRTPKNAKF